MGQARSLASPARLICKVVYIVVSIAAQLVQNLLKLILKPQETQTNKQNELIWMHSDRSFFSENERMGVSLGTSDLRLYLDCPEARLPGSASKPESTLLRSCGCSPLCLVRGSSGQE